MVSDSSIYRPFSGPLRPMLLIINTSTPYTQVSFRCSVDGSGRCGVGVGYGLESDHGQNTVHQEPVSTAKQ